MKEKIGDLILLRGLPGAGKSTVAQLIMTGGGMTDKVIEADSHFYDHMGNYNFDPSKLPAAHNYCKTMVTDFMKMMKPKIVVANTFTQEWEMKPYYELAERHGYRVHTLIVENRHGNKSVHDVPDATRGNMLNRFEIKL
jgi:predicted kinase